jgi:hypothetical protein
MIRGHVNAIELPTTLRNVAKLNELAGISDALALGL